MTEKSRTRNANIKYACLQIMFWTAAASGYGFMTQILQEKGFDSSQIGILNAAKLFATVVFQILIGDFSDRYAKKIPLKIIIAVLAGAASALTLAFYLTPSSFAGVLLISIGFGATFTCISPLIDSISMVYVRHGIKINYAWGRAAGSAAYAVACVLFGGFCEAFGASGILLIQMAVTFGILLIALWMDSFRKNKEELPGAEEEIRQPQRNSAEVHGVGHLLKRYPAYVCFLLGSAWMFMGYNLGTTFLINVMEELGGNNVHYGIAQFVMAASEVPSAMIILKMKKRFRMEWIMVCCAFFMMIKNVAAAFGGSVEVIIWSQCCEMLGFGLFYSGSVFMVNEMLPEGDLVKGMSLVNATTVGLGEGIGSMICGVLRTEYGLHGLMVCSVLVSAVSVLFMLIMCGLQKKCAGGYYKSWSNELERSDTYE